MGRGVCNLGIMLIHTENNTYIYDMSCWGSINRSIAIFFNSAKSFCHCWPNVGPTSYKYAYFEYFHNVGPTLYNYEIILFIFQTKYIVSPNIVPTITKFH